MELVDGFFFCKKMQQARKKPLHDRGVLSIKQPHKIS